MEIIFILTAIVQSVSISLGVGGSTLAILNFFVALADGTIDEGERRMMGVVYIVLRVAMVLILITTAAIAYMYISAGDDYFMPYTVGYWTLLLVLYANATLMTKRIMPSTVGPALQAATWYTLGILTALVPLRHTNFSYFEFVVGYLAAIALAVAIVNIVMAYAKRKRGQSVV